MVWRQYHAATGHDNFVRRVRRVGVLIATVLAAAALGHVPIVLADAIGAPLDPRVRG